MHFFIPIGEGEIGILAIEDLRVQYNKEADCPEDELHTAAHQHCVMKIGSAPTQSSAMTAVCAPRQPDRDAYDTDVTAITMVKSA